jgi:hypothetical protein
MPALLSIQIQPKPEPHATLSGRFSPVLQSRMQAFRGKKISGNEFESLYALPSVLEAVLVSIQLQQTFRKEGLAEAKIGLHADLSLNADQPVRPMDLDILDRILDLGAANTVVMSEPVAEQINNHPEFRSGKIGKIHHKAYAGGLNVYSLHGYGLSSLPAARFYEKLKARLKIASLF